MVEKLQGKRDNILFFVPQADIIIGDQNTIYESNGRIMRELYDLSVSSGLKVLIRYKPDNDEHDLPADMSLCAKYGFDVLDPSRGSLEYALNTSLLAFGCGSSALVLAYNCGVKSYSIKIETRGIFDFSDTRVEQIDIENISKIKLDSIQTDYASDAMKLERLYAL